MKIAIPSYNRVQTLGDKTLYFLTTMRGFQHSDITIFVADFEQYALYQSYYPSYNIVVGERGIVNIRNVINNYYDYDEYIICLDDDIECLLPAENPDLFIEGEKLLFETGMSLWGVNAVSNPFFMRQQQRISYNLKFCIGGMFGMINKQFNLHPLSATKEDIENTILHYIHSCGIVRFNHVSFKSKMFAVGGIGNKRDRESQNNIAVAYLLDAYPSLLSLFTRKDGWREIRLANRHRF